MYIRRVCPNKGGHHSITRLGVYLRRRTWKNHRLVSRAGDRYDSATQTLGVEGENHRLVPHGLPEARTSPGSLGRRTTGWCRSSEGIVTLLPGPNGPGAVFRFDFPALNRRQSTNLGCAVF